MTSDGLELYTAEQFLHGQLAADDTLASIGINSETAPPGSTFPQVQFRCLANTPTVAIGDNVIMVHAVYLVVAVAEFRTPPYSYTPLREYVRRIYAQLHQQSAAVDNGDVLWCSWEEAFRRAYAVNGIEYREWGGRYRVYAQD